MVLDSGQRLADVDVDAEIEYGYSTSFTMEYLSLSYTAASVPWLWSLRALFQC